MTVNSVGESVQCIYNEVSIRLVELKYDVVSISFMFSSPLIVHMTSLDMDVSIKQLSRTVVKE
jgi:hypothetical protein